MLNICLVSLMFYIQTILSGMGELHLEIIHDRIKKEYKLETDLGPLQISYRETTAGSAVDSGNY